MSSLLTGGSYAVSAGLLVYGIERELIPEDIRLGLLMVWAVAGLALAILGLFLNRRTE